MEICAILKAQTYAAADSSNLLINRLAPQVRLKMNHKKPSKFQFYFSGVLEAHQNEP